MDPFFVIIGGLTLFLLLFVVALGLWHPRSGRMIVGRSLRDEGAEAEIEAHDIDEMLDARNARRRAAGKPAISDELAEQVRRPGEWI
jgi:hypothetical protein